MQAHNVCPHQSMSHSTCASQVCPRAGHCLYCRVESAALCPGHPQLPQSHMLWLAAPQ